MQQDVLICVNARLDFFKTYYSVPAAMQAEVDGFIAELTALGECSADAAAFEAAFVSSGLSDRFNALLPRLSPVAQTMTQEQKAYSKEVMQEMGMLDKGQILKDVAADVADTVMVEANEEMISQRRKAMIETGVFDEYTKASNLADDVGIAGKFLKGLFGKKKK